MVEKFEKKFLGTWWVKTQLFPSIRLSRLWAQMRGFKKKVFKISLSRIVEVFSYLLICNFFLCETPF
jgi:hypothetical protein